MCACMAEESCLVSAGNTEPSLQSPGLSFMWLDPTTEEDEEEEKEEGDYYSLFAFY